MLAFSIIIIFFFFVIIISFLLSSTISIVFTFVPVYILFHTVSQCIITSPILFKVLLINSFQTMDCILINTFYYCPSKMWTNISIAVHLFLTNVTVSIFPSVHTLFLLYCLFVCLSYKLLIIVVEKIICFVDYIPTFLIFLFCISYETIVVGMMF